MSQENKEKDEVGIAQIMSGGLASVIAAAMMIFGGPSEPGDRRKALFAALEEVLGYYGMCGLFLFLGLGMLSWGLWARYGSKKSE